MPTTPLLTLIALWIALETAARFGRRLRLKSDDVWNTGLVAVLTGLIVARLWNVIQFRDVYALEPSLILSLRPSGFVWLPGVIAGGVAAYLILLRKALDPVRVLAAFSTGAMAAASILSVAAHLTGSLLGTASTGPLAVWYFGQQLHPAGLYRAAALIAVVILLWLLQDRERPLRTIWLALFGYALVRLIGDAFVAETSQVGPFRIGQVAGLFGAVLGALLLAREENDAAARPAQPSLTDADATIHPG